MPSALIVYGSTTGNTEYVAGVVDRVVSSQGFSTTRLDAAQADAAGLCDGYDLILFGCSTWGQDSIEFQDDFVDLFDNFDRINAGGKTVAVFGCGDTAYPYYCGAVDAIAEKLSELGANVVGPLLKIDGDPQSEDDEIEAWAEKVCQSAK